MASAALGGTYTLSAAGVEQLADLAATSSPAASPSFSSRFYTDASDARGRLSALEGMLKGRSGRAA
jgi:hypothetical protein